MIHQRNKYYRPTRRTTAGVVGIVIIWKHSHACTVKYCSRDLSLESVAYSVLVGLMGFSSLSHFQQMSPFGFGFIFILAHFLQIHLG